jgi:hypothetical protein
LGVTSLCVLVLGALGFLLFQEAAGKLKLVALAMITGGFLGFVALVFIFASNPKPPPQPGKNLQEKTALEEQAAAKLAEGERLYFAGRNDQARTAYGEVLTLYKQEDNRRGQAYGSASWSACSGATIRPASPMAKP